MKTRGNLPKNEFLIQGHLWCCGIWNKCSEEPNVSCEIWQILWFVWIFFWVKRAKYTNCVNKWGIYLEFKEWNRRLHNRNETFGRKPNLNDNKDVRLLVLFICAAWPIFNDHMNMNLTDNEWHCKEIPRTKLSYPLWKATPTAVNFRIRKRIRFGSIVSRCQID